MSVLRQLQGLRVADIRFHPTPKLLDPTGRVFFHDGVPYRAIYEHKAEFVRQLFDTGAIASLVDANLLIGTHLTDMHMDGFGLVLRHAAIDVDTKAHEWSQVTYIEAALQYLRLSRELARHGLGLIDGHHGNFSLSRDSIPIWHDLGSIIESPHGTTLHAGMAEFEEYFYYPLMYWRDTQALSMLRRLGFRLTKEEYCQMHWLHRRLSRLPGLRLLPSSPCDAYYKLHALPTMVRRGLGGPTAGNKFQGFCLDGIGQYLFGTLYRRLSHLTYQPEPTAWTGYYRNEPDSARTVAITNLVEEIRPSRVLDLGANEGYFSHLICSPDYTIISADYDHPSVARHAKRLLSDRAGRRIYPIVFDVGRLDADAKRRYKSDTVMALALTHHLRLGQSFTWDYIAEQFSDLTERCLITEYMPNGLGVGKVVPDPLPDDYNLEAFLKSLDRHFSSVSLIDYDTKTIHPRVLVLCQR